MKIQRKQASAACPATSESVRADAKVAFEELVQFCQTCDGTFWQFEKQLLVRVAVLGACLIRLFLIARYERLDLRPFLEDGKYRPGDDCAERTLKTVYGEVTYGRHYLEPVAELTRFALVRHAFSWCVWEDHDRRSSHGSTDFA